MGAYILVTSPRYVTEVYAKFKDGTQRRVKVSVYRYAYKPSYSWEGFNQEMEFKYVWPCRNAFERSGKRPEQFGIWDSDWKPGQKLTDGVESLFLTNDFVSLNDETLGGPRHQYVATTTEPEYVESDEPNFLGCPVPLEQLEIVFA